MKLTNILICFLFPLFAYASLDGEYESGCFSYAQGKSFKSEVGIKGNSFTSKFYLYDESKCNNLILVVDYSSEVNYPVALDVGPMDHQVKSGLMIVFDPELRDKLNRDKSCGKENIRVGTPLNILGMTQCSPLGIPEKGRILFDMYQKSANKISFGAHPLLWVQKEEKRPVLTSRIQYSRK